MTISGVEWGRTFLEAHPTPISDIPLSSLTFGIVFSPVTAVLRMVIVIYQ